MIILTYKYWKALHFVFRKLRKPARELSVKLIILDQKLEN